MNVLNTLIWTILYTTVIYRNNVVYCTDNGTSPESGSPGSQPASSTPPSTPSSGTTETGTTDTKSSNKTGVTLDIKKTSGDHFTYNKTNNTATFTPKDNNIFNEVKSGDKEIWKTDNNNEYANKVVLDGKGKKEKTVTIHRANGKEVLCLRFGKGKPWNCYDKDKNNPVSININYEKDSFKYTNQLQNDIRTFAAKKPFVFNIVTIKENKNVTEIWKTENEKEYSLKVVREGDKVTIYMGQGDSNKKVFNKGSDGKWTESTSGS